jgi:hypothetical protein
MMSNMSFDHTPLVTFREDDMSPFLLRSAEYSKYLLGVHVEMSGLSG